MLQDTQHIKVYSKRLVYEFDIRNNITIIKGNSGTGKTTLYELIRLADGKAIKLECEKECIAIADKNWIETVRNKTDCILFIDEGFEDLKSKEFAEAVRGSGNYFIIIVRDTIKSLEYTINEIYEIETSGKQHKLVSKYKFNSK